jgi:hypothetical protein
LTPAWHIDAVRGPSTQHCESCRKDSGAPVAVFAAYERTAYTVTKGEIAGSPPFIGDRAGKQRWWHDHSTT